MSAEFTRLGRPQPRSLGDAKPRLSGDFLESRRADSNRGPLHYE